MSILYLSDDGSLNRMGHSVPPGHPRPLGTEQCRDCRYWSSRPYESGHGHCSHTTPYNRRENITPACPLFAFAYDPCLTSPDDSTRIWRTPLVVHWRTID